MFMVTGMEFLSRNCRLLMVGHRGSSGGQEGECVEKCVLAIYTQLFVV